MSRTRTNSLSLDKRRKATNGPSRILYPNPNVPLREQSEKDVLWYSNLYPSKV